MTQEIIEMAQECGLIGMRPHLDGIYSEALVAFAKLVTEAERERIKQANDPEIEKINAHIQKAMTALEEALAEHAMSEVQRLGQEIEQEPVAWGVDWGKAGDIPCVSIIKRLHGGGIEVVAVEYAPYSNAHPPQRTLVGLTDEEILSDDTLRYYYGMNGGAGPVSQKGKKVIAAIEAKLKQKNGYAEEKNT